MRIVFSKDRPAQLDLLLQSIEANLPGEEEMRLVCAASTEDFRRGYELIDIDTDLDEDFNVSFRKTLAEADETITFFCDDDVVFRPAPFDPVKALLDDDDTIAFSFWLGANNRHHKRPPPGFPRWVWRNQPRSNFGFPAAVDGQVFRTTDVVTMIGGDNISNPTFVETVMSLRVKGIKRRMLQSFEQQIVVGVNVNRVSLSSGCSFGKYFPQSTEEINRLWLDGQRIKLSALNFSGIDSLHHEIQFIWERR